MRNCKILGKTLAGHRLRKCEMRNLYLSWRVYYYAILLYVPFRMPCKLRTSSEVRALDYTPFRRRIEYFLKRGKGDNTTDLVGLDGPKKSRGMWFMLTNRDCSLLAKEMVWPFLHHFVLTLGRAPSPKKWCESGRLREHNTVWKRSATGKENGVKTEGWVKQKRYENGRRGKHKRYNNGSRG